MIFTVSKCKCMLISRKHNASTPPIDLNKHKLQNVQCYEYLGLLLSSDLSTLKPHVPRLRNFWACYTAKFTTTPAHNLWQNSIVRPHLEYGAHVWHPHLAKDTSALEKVQKFGLRICSRNWNASYQELLDTFQLP